MTARMMLLGLVLGSSTAVVSSQTMQQTKADTQSPNDAQPMDAAQQKASRTFAQKSRMPAARPPAKPVALTPLSQRERVQQLLDRFTFGARPGEVDQVLAMGADKWLAQQMSPESIPDPVLGRRLADYPTLTMPTQQLIEVFPDRGQIGPVADGKVPYPADPLLNAVYEVQVYKLTQERDQKNPDGSVKPKVELTDAEKAERKKQDQATAMRIAGELLVLPKQQRMATLIKMSVEERIAFTGNGNLNGSMHNLLFADFTPRERETFNAMAGQVSSSYNIGSELAQARILRDVMTERQLQEVMTDFWFNHFNIFIGKDSDSWYTTSYERDVIRKNALGSFHDLLMATAKSPAMMVYLDNWLSIGPDSLANGVNPQNPNSKKGNKGLNENYGREVMELHTVGVNGGYTQADVTALSAILTGWGVDRVNQGGGFLFDPKRHEPGPKTWFGYVIDDNGTVTKVPAGTKASMNPAATFGPNKVVANEDSIKQGIAALNILASSPQTAHFISSLLVQHFVADNPPPALVDRLAKVYLSSNGDIKTLLRALIASPEFNSRQYFHNKVKTPVEFVASAFRSTATEPQNPSALVNAIKTMGMPMYYALPPTGYYLTADQWMNSSALVDRLNFAYQLTNGKFANQKFDAPKLLAMGLLTPSGMGSFTGTGPKTASVPAAHTDAKLVGISAHMPPGDSHLPIPPGADVALHVLEGTMIGAPVSAQTNQLINKQLEQQPANATSTDTLNLLTALVMGAPEFQLR
ncbi:MAG TPA: DUF1800 domain-containing protein [Granulicella sp.]|jgi:uncharacterized protein (DUF1800 family)